MVCTEWFFERKDNNDIAHGPYGKRKADNNSAHDHYGRRMADNNSAQELNSKMRHQLLRLLTSVDLTPMFIITKKSSLILKYQKLFLLTRPGSKLRGYYKTLSCSTQLSTKFVLLVSLKLLTVANSFLLNIAEHEKFSANKYENANYVLLAFSY